MFFGLYISDTDLDVWHVQIQTVIFLFGMNLPFSFSILFYFKIIYFPVMCIISEVIRGILGFVKLTKRIASLLQMHESQ